MTHDELPFLGAMLREAACWDEQPPGRSVDDVLADPALARYVRGWGREGDVAIVAQSDDGTLLGAAWYRLFDPDERGFGFVAADIPELGIAAVPEARSVGVGDTLLRALIQRAAFEGRPGLSLSVDDGNTRAGRLYERLGFRRVERVGTSWTMVLDLGAVRR